MGKLIGFGTSGSGIMLRKTLRFLVGERIVRVFLIAGVILLFLTLWLGVNPIEGSVVDRRIAGTPFHWILFVATMPAWIAGTLIAAAVFRHIDSCPGYLYPCMFFVQVVLYWAAGKAAGALCSRLVTKE